MMLIVMLSSTSFMSVEELESQLHFCEKTSGLKKRKAIDMTDSSSNEALEQASPAKRCFKAEGKSSPLSVSENERVGQD